MIDKVLEAKALPRDLRAFSFATVSTKKVGTDSRERRKGFVGRVDEGDHRPGWLGQSLLLVYVSDVSQYAVGIALTMAELERRIGGRA